MPDRHGCVVFDSIEPFFVHSSLLTCGKESRNFDYLYIEIGS